MKFLIFLDSWSASKSDWSTKNHNMMSMVTVRLLLDFSILKNVNVPHSGRLATPLLNFSRLSSKLIKWATTFACRGSSPRNSEISDEEELVPKWHCTNWIRRTGTTC